jgi:hypothetical protein
MENLVGKKHFLFFSDEQYSIYDQNYPTSIRISGDSKEVVAGSLKGELFLYDLAANKVYMRLESAHNG